MTVFEQMMSRYDILTNEDHFNAQREIIFL